MAAQFESSRDCANAQEEAAMAKKRAVVKKKASFPVSRCAAGVCDPQRTQGLIAPAPNGTHVLVTLRGPGVFLGAEVSKQGGTNDLTFVILDIDGRSVTNLSYAAGLNQGLTQQNPYGLVVLQSGVIKTFTVGFPTPLLYKNKLVLCVTVNEPNVVQILASVIHGAAG
jgi:hypothetical protein